MTPGLLAATQGDHRRRLDAHLYGRPIRDRQRRKLWTLIRTILHVTARTVHRARRVAVIGDHHHGQAPLLGHIGDRIHRRFLARIIGSQAAVDMKICGVPTGRGRLF